MALFSRKSSNPNAPLSPPQGSLTLNTKQSRIKAAQIRTMTALRSFAGYLRDGITFQGNRDVYQVFGYKRFLTYYDMLAKYQRQGIASRIVDMPADAIWDDPPTFLGGTGKLKTSFEDLAQRLSLWHVLNRADRLCGMGVYSTILVGVNDGQPLWQPLKPNPKNKIIFMQPCSYEAMKVEWFEADVQSPRYGLPAMYMLDYSRLADPNNEGATTDLFNKFNQLPSQVHWSRVIHIADSILEDQVYGVPRMQKVFNTLEDMLKVTGGAAETYWLNARGGLHIDVDKELDLDPDDEASLTSEVDDYTNNLRRVIRTQGVNVKPINMTMSDPRHTFEVLLSDLAGSTGIPQSVLIGFATGRLASTQDRANWAVFVEQRRKHFAEPQCIRQVIAFLVRLGALTPADFLAVNILWPEAFKLSPLERGQTSAQQARSVANLMKAFTQVQPGGGMGAPSGAVDENGNPKGTDLNQPLVSRDEARGIIEFGNSAPFRGEEPSTDKGLE